jgi:hypothetical protein
MHVFDEFSIPHSVATVDAQRAVWIAGQGCQRHEVLGEEYNPEQMQRLVASVQGRTDAGISAWLLPEPQNPHDTSAIMVWVLGGKVGYLPRDLALQWQPILASFHRRYGAHVACQAQIDPPSQSSRGAFGVIVWLPILPAPQPASQPRAPVPVHVVAAPAAPAPNRDELDRLRADATRMAVELRAAQDQLKAAQREPEELDRIRADILRAKTDLAAAEHELGSVEEALEIQSFGFYQPRYALASSSEYVVRLKVVRDEQKELLKADTATACATTWKVGGSAAEGKKMVRNQSKLMLRAFNGECDAAIATVKYDNVTALEERITKSCEAINKLGLVQHVSITHRYFALKLAELRLVHEHREKVQQEKDEQRRVKEQMREEQKAQEEIDRANAEAEKAEQVSQAALAKAQHELSLAEATGKHNEKLESLVLRLETELKDALDRKAKAIARAQLTKSGHVYVLSNIGSFGDGVYKIGMTRRLDPLERVEELGDASVPFPFDVHAIIYAEDAPALEAKLQRAFASRRVNLVNHRKEYFRVTLDEIRVAVHELHGLVTFLLIPEAEEYRKTRSVGEAPLAVLAVDPNADATVGTA